MPFSAGPAPEPMPNNWNAYDTHEVFSWESDLPPEADLLAWQDAVLTAGERHRILRILTAPAWGYRRDRDGPLHPWLQRHGDRIAPEPPLPAGFLLGTVRYTTATLLAYATPTGIVEDWFTDVADLAAAAGLPSPRHTEYEPLSLAVVGWDDGSATASLGTATDIWFPRTGPDLLDNHVLAGRNASRLNAFLTDLRAASASIGGTWRWSPFPQHQVEGGLIVL